MTSTRKVRVVANALLILSLAYFLGSAQAQSNSFTQLVDASKSEVEKNGGKLTIGITWTNRQAKPVLAEFKKEFPFVKAISYVRLRTVANMQRMLMEYRSGRTRMSTSRLFPTNYGPNT